MPLHPMQPIEKDYNGVVRFKANAIVRWLVDSGKANLNDICIHGFDTDDMVQFWQQLGYSVSGYGDLSFVPENVIQQADEKAAQILKD